MVPITADTKDWTWVLDRPCPDCRLDTRSIRGSDIATVLADNASSWERVLTTRSDVAVRPGDDRWSVLEYGCHVRDVFVLADRRLRLMLDQDNPTFADWDQDATAVADRYDAQVAAEVAGELQRAAATLAATLRGVDGPAWSRPGRRSNGSAFTVESFARYVLHDPVHHLHDVGGQ